MNPATGDSAFAALPNHEALAGALERLAPWARERGVLDALPNWLSTAADPAAGAANLEALLAAGWDPTPALVVPLVRICGASQALTSVLLSVSGVDAAWLERALAREAVSPYSEIGEGSGLHAAYCTPHSQLPLMLSSFNRPA